MSMIVLDLEWNTVFLPAEDGTCQHFDEIIQIGAVRMEEGFRPADTLNLYVHNLSGSLNPCIVELVHLTDEQLSTAEDFPTVAAQFLEWCGENPRFFTWSNSDIPVLRQNFLHYGLDAARIRRAYNVQFAYSILRQGSSTAVALNKAVEDYGLIQDEPFHSAAGDAIYTARIMQRLWQEFGTKTREGYLYSQLQRFRAAKAQKAPRPASSMLQTPDSFEDWLQSPGRYSVSRQHKKLSCNTHRKSYFRQTSTRKFICPRCKKGMSSGRWQLISENRYANQLHCPEHGKYYALMRLRRKNPYLWEGVVDLYTEQDSPLLAQWVKYQPDGLEKPSKDNH